MNNFSKIFENTKSQATGSVEFNKIEELLKTNSVRGTNNLDAICKWYRTKYENIYKKPMLGYNYYDCRKVIKNLSELLKLPNWEICKLINQWFTKYHELGWDDSNYNDSLTLRVLKTDWLVNCLLENKQKSSRGKSYTKVSSSIRENTEDNEEIITNICF